MGRKARPAEEAGLNADAPVVILTPQGDFEVVGAAGSASGSGSGDAQDAGDATTDTVAELLAANFSPDIVDEVKAGYAKPAWEVQPSELDPEDDIGTFYDYDFALPPEAHDKYMAGAEARLDQLEALRGPTDERVKAAVEARRALVRGKADDDLRWLKHKAYYRGIQKIRAAKAALAAAEADASDEAALAEAAEAGAAAAAAAAAAAKPAKKQQRRRKQQQQQQQQQQAPQARPGLASLYSEDEVLAGVSDPSEWEAGWTAPGYGQHPEVLQQLRSAFAGSLGLPWLSPEQEAAFAAAREAEAAAQAAHAAEQAQAEAHKQALIAKLSPFQAYTPEYAARLRRQQQLDTHRRHKAQAFWLSAGLALGSSVVRWWRARGGPGSGRPGARRRSAAAGQQQAQRPPSRRSTRPPTPIAE